MKQPKKPTYEQKRAITAHSLNAKEWAVIRETDFYLYIINKKTGATKTIDKFLKERR